jgi:hypothetical protein
MLVLRDWVPQGQVSQREHFGRPVGYWWHSFADWTRDREDDKTPDPPHLRLGWSVAKRAHVRVSLPRRIVIESETRPDGLRGHRPTIPYLVTQKNKRSQPYLTSRGSLERHSSSIAVVESIVTAMSTASILPKRRRALGRQQPSASSSRDASEEVSLAVGPRSEATYD